MKNMNQNLEPALGYLIGNVARNMGNRLNANFAQAGYDITSEQWKILCALWEKDGQNQQEISAKTGKDKTSVTRLISHLEKKSLVARVTNPEDRRHKYVRLTPRAKQIQKEFKHLADRTLAEAQEGISSEDLGVCHKVLQKILCNLLAPCELHS